MKTVLILGAGIMQIPAIRIAKSRGWRVVVADGNPDAEGKGLCDRFAHVDLKDLDGLLALARDCAARGGIDGVFTAGTDFSISVAWVAEKMSLPGIPYETARRATDKALMREAFARAGVPSPRFACWTGEGEPSACVRGFAFPLVVKPVDNMGARGVRRVDGPADLAAACSEALPLSRSSRVIVEEFMEGAELSLDAVVYKGEATVCGVADRHIYFPPYFVELGHTMPTDLGSRTAGEAREVFCAGIRALGIHTGAAKGDIKVTPQGAMIGEIAARLSGGYMSGWTFPLSSGVDVTGAALNIAVGLPPGDLAPRVKRVSAERAFISLPGTVREVRGADRARAVEGVTDVFLRARPGAATVFPRNNVEKSGNVITVHEDRTGAVDAARSAISCISVRLDPLDGRTDGFLFGEGTDAFAASAAAFAARIAELPAWTGDPSLLLPADEIALIPMPGWEDLREEDWHGAGFAEALRLSLAECGVRLSAAPGGVGFALGRPFWKAFLRGSRQGALYLADSVRAAAGEGRLGEYLGRVCG
jgi:biotin carboxylase